MRRYLVEVIGPLGTVAVSKEETEDKVLARITKLFSSDNLNFPKRIHITTDLNVSVTFEVKS